MADLQKTIEILFEGVDNTSGVIDAVSTDLSKLAGSAQKVTGPMATVAESLLAIEAAAIAAGVVLLKIALNDAVEFESALIDLQKVLGAGEGDVADYIVRIEDLALAYGVNASAVTQMAADWKAAGFTAEDVFGGGGSLGLAEVTLQTVKVSALDASAAANVLIRTLSGMGLESSESARLLDILNEVSATSAANFEELSEGMAILAPIAGATGLSMEELAGYLVPVIANTQDGSEAATGLKTSFLSLVSDTKSVITQLERLGIVTEGYQAGTLSLTEILDKLALVWPTLTAETQAYTAAELVGKNQTAKFLALMNDFGTALESTEVAMKSQGSAVKELEVRMAAAEEVVNRSLVAWELLSAAIGLELLDNFKAASEASTGFAEAMKEVVDNGGLKPLFDTLKPLMVSFSDQLTDIAALLPAALDAVDWDKFSASIDALGDALGDLFGGLDLTTAEGLAAAMQNIVNVGASLNQTVAGIIAGLTPMIHAAAAAAVEFGNLSAEEQQATGEALGFAKALNDILGFASGAIGALQGIAGALGVIAASSLFKTLPTLVTTLGTGGLVAAASGAKTALAALAVVIGGYNLGRLIADWTGLNDAFSETATSIADDKLADLPLILDEISVRTGVAVTSIEGFNSAVDAGALIFDDAAGKWVAGGNSLAAFALDGAEAANASTALGAAASAAASGAGALGTAVALAGGGLSAYGAIAAGASGESEEFRLEMEKLATDTRLKNMEFKMALNIAEVEANAEIATTALEGLQGTIESTGTLLGTLFGLLAEGKADEFSEDILAQIEKEAEAREKALELQAKLVEAQIDYMGARTERLLSNDPLIQIDGANLQPHLEAFMWEILEAVQVRVNEDGLELLLGVEAAA